MRIVDSRKSISTLIAAFCVIFLFGLAGFSIEVFIGKAVHLDEWARGFIGGLTSAGTLYLLIKNGKHEKRS